LPSRLTVSPKPPPPDRPGRHQNLAIAPMQFSKLLTGIDSVVMKLKSSPTWCMIVGGT
jgi:hypothetical protein